MTSSTPLPEQGGFNERGSYTTDYDQRKAINQKYLLEKKDVSCYDCGLRWHPMVITFDHVGRKGKYTSGVGKRMSPASMITYDPIAFKNMLDACQPVCMNCHKIREARRDRHLVSKRWVKWSDKLSKGALLKEEDTNGTK